MNTISQSSHLQAAKEKVSFVIWIYEEEGRRRNYVL